MLASFARAHDWAGLEVNLTHRMKMASVASTAPSHMSAQVAATLRSWWMPALRLAADAPIEVIVARLNGWQVIQEPDGRLTVLLGDVPEGFADQAVREQLEVALAGQGARVPAIEVKRVKAIAKTAAGKASLIQATRPATTAVGSVASPR